VRCLDRYMFLLEPPSRLGYKLTRARRACAELRTRLVWAAHPEEGGVRFERG
jgi:hypothetical protein